MMIEPYKKSIIFYFTLAILLLNLIFSSGWDIWIQTLTLLAACLLVLLCILPGKTIELSSILLTPTVLILITVMILDQMLSLMPSSYITEMYAPITAFTVFGTAASYLSNTRFRSMIIRLFPFAALAVSIADILYPHITGSPLFPNPNIKVGFFILIIPPTLWKLFNKHLYRPRDILLSIIIMAPIFISFHKSNSAWGWTVLILTGLAYLKISDNLNLDLFVISSLSLLVLVLTFTYIFKTQDILSRLAWLKSAAGMILNRPFTGYGSGAYPHIIPAFTSSSFLSIYAHSYFIQFAAEYGLIASAMLLWLIIRSLKSILRVEHPAGKIIFVTLTLYIFYSLLEYSMGIPINLILFWFLIGTFSGFRAKTIQKTIYLQLTVILILVPACFIAGKTAMKPFRASTFYARGVYELKKGDIGQADVFFEQALSLIDRYPPALLGYANINLNNGRLEQAARNILDTIPYKKSGPVTEECKDALSMLGSREEGRARAKIINALSLRLLQHGLDPRKYIVLKH